MLCMNRNGNETLNRRPRYRATRARPFLPTAQVAIEHHGMRLRAQLNLADHEPLHQHHAFALIPDCDIYPLKNVPGILLRSLNHFRTRGKGCAAWAVPEPNGSGHVDVFFNDEHHPWDIRVHLMEEFFHLYLHHEPDRVRVYFGPGGHRTYNSAKEEEAAGAGMAALVPYGGLESRLAQGQHLDRIAEAYQVPAAVIRLRIEVTRLADLLASPTGQLPLLGAPPLPA
jgi:hypothetical protein